MRRKRCANAPKPSSLPSGTFTLSCVFIASYDPRIDSGAVELQKKVDAFLTLIAEQSATPAGEYEQHLDFYAGARSDIDTLRTIAASQKGNERTLKSLDLIEDNLRRLETLHSEGISPEEIAIVRTLFDTQFRMLVQFENAKKRKEN